MFGHPLGLLISGLFSPHHTPALLKFSLSETAAIQRKTLNINLEFYVLKLLSNFSLPFL